MKIGEGGKIQGNRDSQSYAKTDIIFFHRGDVGKVRVPVLYTVSLFRDLVY